jgi:hypothetical protein
VLHCLQLTMCVCTHRRSMSEKGTELASQHFRMSWLRQMLQNLLDEANAAPTLQAALPGIVLPATYSVRCNC